MPPPPLAPLSVRQVNLKDGMKKPPKMPTLYPCANCDRALDLRGYAGSPSSDTPADRIHELTDSALPPFAFFSLHCSTCDHFTLVRAFR